MTASRRLWYGCMLATVALSGVNPANASPIKHHEHAERAQRIAALADAHDYRTWSHYLLAGPSVWKNVAHPDVTPAVESAIWKAFRTDATLSNRWIRFLAWRQSLDPARFDYWHPRVAVALDRMSARPATPIQIATPPPGTPSNETPTPPTQGQSISTIPEPSAWLMAISFAAWGVWQHRRRSSDRNAPRASADDH
jgi:hypothetical protein